MAYTPRNQRYTVYDVMEARGAFRSNPANPDSMDEDGRRLYAGPQRYPKMFYHPKGEERITRPADVMVTPMGPKLVGEERQIITKIAKNEEEEKKLRTEGWHDHPAKAIAAGGRDAPPISSAEHIKSLEEQIAELQRQLAATEVKKEEIGGTRASPNHR